ncbi:MAG TPA: LuxR C-terminal-related transcriptional regulator [Acetobacteraceae bacterium]|nr:LuxR C-terminal-related transcriptional regulator [Acetobacteraceae bacterium]
MHNGWDERVALIEQIYEAALDPQVWPDVADRLADLAGAPICQISTCNGIMRTVVNITPRVPPEALRRYDEYWVYHNPLIAIGRRQPIGEVLSIHDLMPRDELMRTAIYNEFFSPLGLEEKIGARLEDDGSSWAALGVWRPARMGAFNGRTIRLLKALIPHLQQALQMNARIAEIEMLRTASAELLDQLGQGSILVDGACRILFANRTAETILADQVGLLRDAAGVVRSSLYTETCLLHKLVAESAERAGVSEAGAGGSQRISRGKLRAPLTVLVIPLRAATDWLAPRRAAAILFVTDPEAASGPNAAGLRYSFGLTQTEAAMAVEVVKGGGLKAAAARLGIAPTTARTHLTAVFSKTNTRRQADLVRVLLQGQSAFCNITPAGHHLP